MRRRPGNPHAPMKMKTRTLVSAFAMCLLGYCLAAAPRPPSSESPATGPIAIESGLITGIYADEKEDIRVFKGIPYAAPPVGQLRWKPPRPAQPWQGARACDRFAPACPQPDSLTGQSVGRQDEDCLYLNVWTPAEGAEAKRPAMVWIHGGGCTTGAGSMPLYDGGNFARQGVVLVTINYRLGPLGFLAHPLLSKESENDVSGNYGFLDQIAALQWVQRNIAAFGGDPDCVTIFGESAGSASVARLMVSPLARGLFHRAIAQSGGARGNNCHLRQASHGLEPMEKLGQRIAEKLGCAQARDPLGALRSKTPEEILAASEPAQGLFGKGNKFGWVVDGWALPDDPAALFDQGRQWPVAFLAGFNADEWTIFQRNLPVKGALGYSWMVRGVFGDSAPQALELFPVEGNDVQAALNRLVTLMAFGEPARAMARAMEKAGAPAYLYYFTRVTAAGRALGLGAFHGQEIPFVFGTLPPRRSYSGEDRDLSRIMQAYWVNFAKTGNPNGPGLPEWPAHAKATDACLELGNGNQSPHRLVPGALRLPGALRRPRDGTRP